MKIINNTKARQGVHTTKGVVYLAPGERRYDLELTPEGLADAKRVEGLGVSEEAVAPAGESGGDNRESAIVTAIKSLRQEDFTQAGKPDVAAINLLLGDGYDRVTAGERDALWDKMQAPAA